MNPMERIVGCSNVEAHGQNNQLSRGSQQPVPCNHMPSRSIARLKDS